MSEIYDLEDLKSVAHPEAILWDGFNEAIIGVSTDGRMVYDIQLMIEVLMVGEGMSEEDALDHLDYNVLNTYINEYNPIHIHPIVKEKVASDDES